jgi:hypothetical protein
MIPLLFVKNDVTVNSYLDIITLRLVPQWEEHCNDFIFQQDVVALHFHKAIQSHLNAQLHQRWIRRAAANHVVWRRWTPGLPVSVMYDLFL